MKVTTSKSETLWSLKKMFIEIIDFFLLGFLRLAF